jgi:chemotaxis protein methyltransferase CheR
MAVLTHDLDYLRNVVTQRSGNVVTAAQDYLFESRLQPLLAGVGLENLEDLITELRRAPFSAMHDRVAEAMTINETSFFRDQQPFDALRDVILPRIIAHKQNTRCLTIWSAACSSGQEPYSLAMLIRESFPELDTWQVRVLATDLSEDMVLRTRTGAYSQFEVNRGLPARMLMKYFDRHGTQWIVKPELRRMIDCRRANLTTIGPGLPPCDIILLRNVLIYFDLPGKEQILGRIHHVLQPHGCLFLGGGETLINMKAPFVREPVAQTVCFRPV